MGGRGNCVPNGLNLIRGKNDKNSFINRGFNMKRRRVCGASNDGEEASRVISMFASRIGKLLLNTQSL